MTDRLLIAYGLMLLMAVWIGGFVWWKRYHSFTRSYARVVAAGHKKEAEAAKAAREAGSEP
jgi:hypothetical protein